LNLLRTYLSMGREMKWDAGFLLIAGLVVLLLGSPGLLRAETKIMGGTVAYLDKFGVSVFISGDYAIVGAPGDDVHGEDSGSVYFWRRVEPIWIPQKCSPTDGAAGDNFGNAVSISGDYAVVGAKGDGDSGVLAGSAYILHRSISTWDQQVKLTEFHRGII